MIAPSDRLRKLDKTTDLQIIQTRPRLGYQTRASVTRDKSYAIRNDQLRSLRKTSRVV